MTALHPAARHTQLESAAIDKDKVYRVSVFLSPFQTEVSEQKFQGSPEFYAFLT
jgi:hypothetical protein